jgi:hypothetical protein
MKTLMSIIAIIALGLTIIPAILLFNGVIDADLHKKLMAVGAILWFLSAPIWFRKKKAI